MAVAFTDVNSLQTRHTQLQLRLKELMGRYTEKYPEVIRVRTELEHLKRQMAMDPGGPAQSSSGAETMTLNPAHQRLKEDLGKVEQDLATARLRVEEMGRQLGEIRSKAATIPKHQQALEDLTRIYRVDQEIYSNLLKRLEETKVTLELEVKEKTILFKVMEFPARPHRPVFPSGVHLILIGLLLGAAAGIGAIYATEMLDRSFRSEEDLRETLGIPVLGSVVDILTERDRQRIRRVNWATAVGFGGFLLFVGALVLWEFLGRFTALLG